MDVSVIVPFYNNVEWLYEAINSIEEDGKLSYEVIIIDDGSKETIDFNKILHNRDRLRYIRQTNQGPGKARNVGIDEAKGEYIAFLDSDDLFVENKLTKQLSFMRENKYVWTHTSYSKFYLNEQEVLVDNKHFSGNIFPKCLAYNPIATPTVMVKKDALMNPEKRFSEIMRFGQDGFMWCQLASFYSVGVLKEPLSKVRMRGGNATLKARNHLYVKSKMYQYFTTNKRYFGDNKIPTFFKIVFGLSHISHLFIEGFLAKFLKQNFVEYSSRFLYSPQYLLLKLYKKLN